MNIELLAEAIKAGEHISTSTHALGGGEWSIEVHGSQSGFIGEYVGLNGTRDGEEATDLWGEYYADYAEAGKLSGVVREERKGNGGRNQRRR